MKKTTALIASIAGIASLGVVGFASAQLMAGDSVGTTDTAVTSALEAAGYQVLEMEVEADEIEALVSLDGALFEIEVDPATGEILEIEAKDEDGEDEDEDDDDDDEDEDGEDDDDADAASNG